MKKKWLVVIGLALLVGVLGLAGCGTDTSGTLTLQGNLSGQQEGIWVTGEGKVQADPDIAILSLGVQAQALTAADAQAQVSQGMDGVMQVLKGQGIAEKDIQTQYYTITQLTRWNDSKQVPEVTGYQVTNSVSARIRDVSKTGPVIDAVVAAAGDLIRINNVSFDINDATQFNDAARKLAIANAKAKAQQIASESGVKLGKITYITESISYPGPIYRTFAAADSAAPMPVTSINPGQLDITSNVQIVYSIDN